MSRPHSLVLWKAIFLTSLCAAAIGGLWWWGLVRSPRAQVQGQARASLDHMIRTIDRSFERAEATGHAFCAWWTQEGGRLDDSVKLQNVIAFLEKGDIITNLLLSRENGDSACVVRKDGEWSLVLFRGGRHPRQYRVRGGHWVPWPTDPREVYDARQRPWYRFGAGRARPAWTPEAYRYFDSGVGGFTYAVPVRDSRGALKGVIGVDVSLEELTHLIWEDQPTPGTQAAVTDPEGRLLVPPRSPGTLDMGTRFGLQMRPWHPSHQGSRASGGNPIVAEGAFSVPGKPQMRLRVAIPEEEVFPTLFPLQLATFLLALGGVLGAAWSLLDLHRRLVRPMRELAIEAAFPGAGDLPDEDFHSDIWEIEQVGRQVRVAGRAAEERQRLLTQAEHRQRVNAVEMMAPGIVHDVNNQLSVVLSQLSLCQSQLEDQPKIQPRLRAAEGATLKCAEVLRGLLDYSRPNPGQRELMSPNAALEGAVALLRGVLGDAIRVELDLDPRLPLIIGEPIKIQQVLVNLGLNARDAMPRGGRLTFRTFPCQGKACLEVGDTGCGMDEAVKQRIFEPFFSTKAPGQGTGLGLAMVANIVAAHGGQIQVASAPGEGTTFLIQFPPAALRGVEASGGDPMAGAAEPAGT